MSVFSSYILLYSVNLRFNYYINEGHRMINTYVTQAN